jgi:hypothetical protein
MDHRQLEVRVEQHETCELFRAVWAALPPVANEIIGDRLVLVDSLAAGVSKGCAVVELRDSHYVIHLDETKLLAPADEPEALWNIACQLAVVFLGCLRLDDEDAARRHAMAQAEAWGFVPPYEKDEDVWRDFLQQLKI